MKCFTCKSDTSNPRFCSRSCAAKHNNKLFPKRNTLRKCAYCQVHSVKNGRKYCQSCFQNKLRGVRKDGTILVADFMTLTIGEVRAKRKYQKNSSIRDSARRVFFRTNPEPSCFECGYDKHVEVCHVIPISSYPDDTLVSEINSLSNLVALCPTHHWELDHGMLHINRNT